MDTKELKIKIMENVLIRLVNGKFDDLCEASVAAEVALEIIDEIEKLEQ